MTILGVTVPCLFHLLIFGLVLDSGFLHSSMLELESTKKQKNENIL